MHTKFWSQKGDHLEELGVWCECNIRMYLTEREWQVVNRFHLTQNRDQSWALVNMELNFRI
jgi:hypothetical protein